jgi:D-glycero-D-manno-heptose 1,7-bisphosphate phosphatase
VTAAVFLDRDGTIIHNRHYLADPGELELLPGAAAALHVLQDSGFALVVVTNQSGVGRGYFSAADLERQHERLRGLLAADGVELAAIYACLHAPGEGCDCRKPQPGMLMRAARALDLDLARSFLVGDEPTDVEAGRASGVTSYLLGEDAADLAAAAALICARAASPRA